MPKIDAKKICLLRTSALGDVIHALALVNGLRKGYPDAHLTWILQTLSYEIVKNQKNIDRFIIYDRRGGLRSWYNLFRKLREEYYDLVLIPQVSAKVSLISMFVRADIKLGFDVKRSREFHWLVTNKRIMSRPPQHVQDQFFEFLDFLEIKDYPIEWNLTLTDDERAWRRSFFQNFKRPVISFVIASSNRRKDWYPQGYAKAIDYVDTILNMQPMLVGGPSVFEKKITEKICGLCKSNPVVALGKSIRHMILQLSGSSMVISPDTGPLHIAVALNVPTVSLYGYSDPRRCGPYKKYRELLIDKYTDPGEENAPITRRTRSNRMRLITPEEVIEKIELGIEKYIYG